MTALRGWRVLQGTYEDNTQLKIVPNNRNDSRFVMYHGRSRYLSNIDRLFAGHIARQLTLLDDGAAQ